MERLILCGGGHVSLELAHIAHRLDFELHVIDDRPEFASAERFPMAAVYPQEFGSALAALEPGPEDYYCVLTRGHALDAHCVAAILPRPFVYLGMMGSRSKVEHCRRRLLELGFSPRRLEALHAPIGLDIGGQTPAEIAVSIAAQLVQARAEAGGPRVRPPEGAGVLVTVVEKHGSAPRGRGAWMLVSPDGTCTGTIGGGPLEFQAAAMARRLWAEGGGPLRHTFDLAAGGREEMVCGGRVTVEFTRREN